MSASVHYLRQQPECRAPLTLVEMLASIKQIKRATDWLLRHHICVLGFRCSRKGPVISVAPHPNVYALAHGEAERCGYQQKGALRHERWEFSSQGIRITWEEVVCVH